MRPGAALRARVSDAVDRAAVAAIEVRGWRWAPGVSVLHVPGGSVLAEPAALRRVVFRLEGDGVVGPGWLTLARFPATLWTSASPVVVFAFEAIEDPDQHALLDVLEETGWASLRIGGTPPASLQARGMVRATRDGGDTGNGLRVSTEVGHAEWPQRNGLAMVPTGCFDMSAVRAWALGDAAGVVRSAVTDRARRVLGRRAR